MASESRSSLLLRFFDPAINARDARGRTLHDILQWPDEYLERSHDYIQMLFPLPEGSPFNFAAPVIDREVLDAFRSRAELRLSLRQAFIRIIKFYGFVIKNEGRFSDRKGTSAEKENFKALESETIAPVPVDELEVIADDDTTSGKQRMNKTTGNKSEGPGGMLSTQPATNSAPPKQTSSSLREPLQLVRGPNFPEAALNWVNRFDHNHLRITRILRCLRVLGLQNECEAFFAAVKEVHGTTGRIGQRSLMYWTRAVERPLYIAPDDDKISWLKKWEDDHKTTEKVPNLDGPAEQAEAATTSKEKVVSSAKTGVSGVNEDHTTEAARDETSI